MTLWVCVSFSNPRKGMLASHAESLLEGEADHLQGHRVLWHFFFVRMSVPGTLRLSRSLLQRVTESYSPSSAAGERQHNSALLPSPAWSLSPDDLFISSSTRHISAWKLSVLQCQRGWRLILADTSFLWVGRWALLGAEAHNKAVIEHPHAGVN